MRILYPRIRIHLWGGLGSQLFGLALLLDLKKVLPRRDFCLIFHSGGVTRREPDLVTLIGGIPYKVVDDFQDSGFKFPLSRIFGYLGRVFKWGYRFPCRKLRLIASGNSREEFNHIKPWVISVRGHYSTREISRESLKFISDILASQGSPIHLETLMEIGIHYRLGDLIDLGNKKPIDSQRIFSGLTQAKKLNSGIGTIAICSDSPELAVKEIIKLESALKLSTFNLSPINTVKYLIEIDYFVGSPSKISEWVAMIRVIRNQGGKTLLPNEMKNQITTTLGKNLDIQYF